MSFVAHPYERFADDLLTALTGGVIREEHKFVGAEEPYVLASPGVVPASVKVFGQRNEAFALFERGIDYIYDSEQEAIKWKTDGKLPDDQTFFYANYFLQEGQRRLTDRNPGSVTTTLAEAFARELAVLHKQMELIYQSAFVDMATNASLDHVAALLGLTRKDAKFASGEALFKRDTPAPADITIAAGTLISTVRGQNFETTDKRTLRTGQLSVIVPIRAQVEGPEGRVEAGAIQNINRPIFGIETVMNEAATFFATAKETDEEFRRRLKGTLERAGKATLEAIKYGLIEDLPEITETNIQVTEGTDLGVVEVKLGLESTGDADLIRRIEEAIFNSKAAGVRVVHNLATRSISESLQRVEAGISREQAVADFAGKGEPLSAVHPPAEVLTNMPEGIFDLRAEVLLQLVERNLSAAQKEGIEDQVRTVVKDYIEALPMGEVLVYNKLLGQIVAPEEISDAALLVGPTTGELYKANLSTAGRKAKIELDNVFVGLMEAVVFIKIEVKLMRAGGADGRSEVTPKLRAEVEDAINRTLAAAKTKLSKAELKTAIAAAVKAADSTMQLIEGDAVMMSAEYEETGRLLDNTEEVVLEEHHVMELRPPSINLQGVLDG